MSFAQVYSHSSLIECEREIRIESAIVARTRCVASWAAQTAK